MVSHPLRMRRVPGSNPGVSIVLTFVTKDVRENPKYRDCAGMAVKQDVRETPKYRDCARMDNYDAD